MSLPVSVTGASTTNPQRPERRKSRAPRQLPATEAQQHDIVHDIVLETAVAVAPDPARDQVPVDGLPTAAVIDQTWQANPLQKLLPVDWEAITLALSTLSARSMADPVNATTVAAKLNMRLWQEAAETWIGTASRWWGLATPTEERWFRQATAAQYTFGVLRAGRFAQAFYRCVCLRIPGELRWTREATKRSSETPITKSWCGAAHPSGGHCR